MSDTIKKKPPAPPGPYYVVCRGSTPVDGHPPPAPSTGVAAGASFGRFEYLDGFGGARERRDNLRSQNKIDAVITVELE